MDSVCKCGCGKTPKGKNSEYCKGHYIRSADTIRNISGKNNPFYGRHHTRKTKKRMSVERIGRKSPMKGKRHTKESRKKMSESLSGEKHPFYGKHHTKETLKKLSKALTGKHPSEETRNKISKSLVGRCFSKATLKKMSASQSGKNHPFYGKFGKYSSRWLGGKYSYWHRLAWKKFGKCYCEICGTTDKEYRKISKLRFEMHNCLQPKDYTCMKSKAWLCLCASCHKLAEDFRCI
jgi:hypothetical protein